MFRRFTLSLFLVSAAWNARAEVLLNCNFAQFERSGKWIAKTWPEGKRDKLVSDSKIANCPTHITAKHHTGMLSVLFLSALKMNEEKKKYDCIYRSDLMKYDDPEGLTCEFD